MKTIGKEYAVLFNEVTDACKKLDVLSGQLSNIARGLMDAQMRTEEIFLEDEAVDALLPAEHPRRQA